MEEPFLDLKEVHDDLAQLVEARVGEAKKEYKKLEASAYLISTLYGIAGVGHLDYLTQ